MDQSVRGYEIFRGRMDTIDFSIGWIQEGTITTDSSVVLLKPKADSISQGTFAIKVVAKNPNGNARTDSSESNWVYYGVEYFPPILPPDPVLPGEVLIPNIITPNGDGINDRFFIEPPVDGTAYEQISLSIFNRNGKKVYENLSFEQINDRSNGWAGANTNGQALGNGVYYYILEMRSPSSGASQSIQGNVTISGAL
jgi:gliding motility-associated-like protein